MTEYRFKIEVIGHGDNIQQAWNNAVKKFSFGPHPVPDEFALVEHDEDGNEIIETSDGVYNG